MWIIFLRKTEQLIKIVVFLFDFFFKVKNMFLILKKKNNPKTNAGYQRTLMSLTFEFQPHADSMSKEVFDIPVLWWVSPRVSRLEELISLQSFFHARLQLGQ